MPESKMDEWFGTRRWRVAEEVTGLGLVPAVPGGPPEIEVAFDHGHFEVAAPGAFKSPLSGNPGRRGILLQEVDAEGQDIPGQRYPFGDLAVRKARDEFHAIA